MEKLQEELTLFFMSLDVLDVHAHGIGFEWDEMFRRPFTEGDDVLCVDRDVPMTFFFMRSMRELGELYGCEGEEVHVLRVRKEMGIEKLMKRCFEAARIKCLLLDDGFLTGKTYDIDWHRNYIDRVYRILRIETLAQDILEHDAVDSLESFTNQFQNAITDNGSFIGYKSICAYRTGLDLNFEFDYDELSEKILYYKENNLKRLDIKIIIDYVVYMACLESTKNRFPIQFHTGFGDPDLDLMYSNPLHLRKSILNPAYGFSELNILLLHSSYPYSREAGYLASVYPNVYVDISLSFPHLSSKGMKKNLEELLELAPYKFLSLL